MKSVITSIDQFLKENSDRPVILFGAGRRAFRIVNTYNLRYKFAVDSNNTRRGCTIKGKYGCVGIEGWDYLMSHYEKNDIILITPEIGYREIEQIINARLDSPEIYVFSYMVAVQWDVDRIRTSKRMFNITKGEHPKVPRIIHYFWFSGDPYPEKVKRCLDSWHKYCPDYEFKLWDLNNYKTDNVFCNEALSKRVWAFASDYGRCDVLYRYGGIYLDLDVELLKPLDDLLYDEGFFCFESAYGVDPGSGMGCVKGNPIWKEIRQKYENIHFINEDGSYNKVNIVNQYTSVLENHGLVKDGCYQNVDGVAVYPPLVFSPYSYQTGIDSRYEKTYGVHHWVSAWITEEERVELEERKNIISSYVKENGGMDAFL